MLDLEDLIKTNEKMLTLYLDTDPSGAFGKKGSIIWLKSEIKNLKSVIDKKDLDLFETLSNKMINYLNGIIPEGKSLILFLSKDFITPFFVNVPVKNEISFGLPSMSQYYWVKEEHRDYGIVFTSTKEIKLFIASLGVLSPVYEKKSKMDFEDWKRKTLMPPTGPRAHNMGGAIGGGDLKDGFKDRAQNFLLRFFRETEENIKEELAKRNIKEIFIAGTKETRFDFLSSIPTFKDFKIIGSFSVDKDLLEHNVLEKTNAMFKEYEKRRKTVLLRKMFDLASTGEKAGVGLSSVLKSIQEGRADTVLISQNFKASFSHCLDCNFVFENSEKKDSKKICLKCGSENITMQSSTYLLPLLIKSFNVNLEVLDEESSKDLKTYGGIGAIWRY